MPSNFSPASTRAASITSAVPDALSFAPGASLVAFITSLTRLSICPATITTWFGSPVPFWIASTSTTSTPSGARGPVKRSAIVSTVRHPPQAFEIVSNSVPPQRRAAPIPRLGSVGDESVWRVPKLTSVSTVAFSRAGSGARVWAMAGLQRADAAARRISFFMDPDLICSCPSVKPPPHATSRRALALPAGKEPSCPALPCPMRASPR